MHLLGRDYTRTDMRQDRPFHSLRRNRRLETVCSCCSAMEIKVGPNVHTVLLMSSNPRMLTARHTKLQALEHRQHDAWQDTATVSQ